MSRRSAWFTLATFLSAALIGCRGHDARVHFASKSDPTMVVPASATEIEYPDASACSSPMDARQTPPPLDVDSPPEFWDVTLEEVVQLALANSEVLRDVGGAVVANPNSASTVFDPAIQESDPQFGVNAALAAFDTSFSARAFFENNDRPLNNLFEGGGTRLFQQDLHNYELGLRKRTAAGTSLYVQNLTDYNFNNAPGNNVPNLPWGERVEMGFRQPLLQGAGVEFNRIAGPGSATGIYNGVMIARLRTDISLADFEASVQNLVGQVENAYWELYFAYRDLDAKLSARDRALQTWRQINSLYQTGQRGGEAEQEWQAREQYYRLQAEVQDALMGRAIEQPSSNNLQAHGGVQASERQLRLLVGLPATDGRLMRPSDSPSLARVVFDWTEALDESLERRVELRRQKWQIVGNELEVIAAKNYLLPRLDVVGAYRFRGIGQDLLRSDRDPGFEFDNAFQSLTSGDFQEWTLGLDLTVPLGYRRGSAAVRHAELQLSRARAILREQEQQVVNQLSAAISEVRRAYRLAQTNYNRQIAAREQLAALEAVFQDAEESERIRLLDLLLDAQRRWADAESNYHRSLAEYAVAIKNVHHTKGSLLDFNEIYLAEGPWPMEAYQEAGRRKRSGRPRPWLDAHLIHRSPGVSRGPYWQQLDRATATGEPRAAAEGLEVLPLPNAAEPLE